MPEYPSAPLLISLKSEGSTFYSFSSTANDITKAMNGQVLLQPSKFALIKLPTWNNLEDTQKLFVEQTKFGQTYSTNPNLMVPKAIQNYIENMLQMAPYYKNSSSYTNFAEQAFWKFLQIQKAINFTSGTPISGTNTYKEAAGDLEDYESVIKYIGDVTMLNNIEKDGVSQNEMYMYIPTEKGVFSEVLLTKKQNHEFSLTSIPEETGAAITSGLDQYPNQQVGAYYDLVTNKYSVATDKDNLGIWFEQTQANANIQNQGNFEFNAVLLYYDIWPAGDTTKLARNLYGILFLDSFKDSGSSTYTIPSETKYQPSETNEGNAFGIKLNYFHSNSTNQVVSGTIINDYDTISMQLYLDAIAKLNQLTTQQQTIINNLLIEKSTNDQILSLLQNLPNVQELIQRLDTLEQKVNTINGTYRVSNEDLFELFRQAVEQGKAANSIDITINYPVTT